MGVVCMWRKTVTYRALRQVIVRKAGQCTGDQGSNRDKRPSFSSQFTKCHRLQGLVTVPRTSVAALKSTKAVSTGQELMTVVLTILYHSRHLMVDLDGVYTTHSLP